MIAREWTAAETRFVSRLAGLVPIGKLATDLDRDPADVADECARIGVDPRYEGVALHWCPFCSQWRHRIVSSGVFRGLCPVCARRRQIETIEGRIADLWPRLTPEQRRKYNETEAERWSVRDPPPRAPDCAGMGERERVAAETAYMEQRSKWEAAQATRRMKAAQKRKERIEAKVRENERKGTKAMSENENEKWEPVTSRHHLDPGIQPYTSKHVGMGCDEANRKAERDHYNAQYQHRYHTDAPSELFE